MICGATHIVDVAEHILQGFKALDEALRITFSKQRHEEFRLVAEFLQRLAHLVSMLCVELAEIAAKLVRLLPSLAEYLARMSPDRFS
jgi:hypothetical protein